MQKGDIISFFNKDTNKNEEGTITAITNENSRLTIVWEDKEGLEHILNIGKVY